MYIPKQGDIIYLSFNPQAGHEQSGRRPVLVVSRDDFNVRTGLAMVCPITNTDRGLPVHICLPESATTTGVILCEQVKSLDMRAREPEFREKVDADTLFEAIDTIQGFIEL